MADLEPPPSYTETAPQSLEPGVRIVTFWHVRPGVGLLTGKPLEKHQYDLILLPHDITYNALERLLYERASKLFNFDHHTIAAAAILKIHDQDVKVGRDNFAAVKMVLQSPKDVELHYCFAKLEEGWEKKLRPAAPPKVEEEGTGCVIQ